MQGENRRRNSRPRGISIPSSGVGASAQADGCGSRMPPQASTNAGRQSWPRRRVDRFRPSGIWPPAVRTPVSRRGRRKIHIAQIIAADVGPGRLRRHLPAIAGRDLLGQRKRPPRFVTPLRLPVRPAPHRFRPCARLPTWYIRLKNAASVSCPELAILFILHVCRRAVRAEMMFPGRTAD